MTKEKANKVARALEAIQSFEYFMDRIEQVLLEEGADCPEMGHVAYELRKVMEMELERREAVLEEL